MSEVKVEKKMDLGQIIIEALNNKELPNIYFNGFIQSIGTGDIMIVLKRNENPVAILNTSYTVAKSFVQQLNNLISSLELKTSNTIMTTDDIKKKLFGGNGEKGKSNKRK